MQAPTFAVPPPQDHTPADSPTALAELLGHQDRRGPTFRKSFIQNLATKEPGPMRHFVIERRLTALRQLLLVHSRPIAGDFDATFPNDAWATALGHTGPGGPSTVSRNWAFLEKHKLIKREREDRLLKVTPLREDGSEKPYTKPKDRFFCLPLTFFTSGWFAKLDLPSTAVLLIALRSSTNNPWFTLRTEVESEWYGIGADTLYRGLDGLRDAKLLHAEPVKVRNIRARGGTTTVNHYCLLGDFMHPDQSLSDNGPA